VRGQRAGLEGLQAADVGAGLDRRLSGRRQLHAAPLWTEHGAEQSRLLRVCRLRQVLHRVAHHSGFPRAQPALPRDASADGSRCRVEPPCIAVAQRAHPAVGPGIQEAPDPAGRLAVPRRRSPLIMPTESFTRRRRGARAVTLAALAAATLTLAALAAAADMNK